MLNKVHFDQKLHRYYVDESKSKEYPGYSYICSQLGLSKPFFNAQAALAKGTYVHKTLELYDNDDLGEHEPWVEPYIEHWKEFKKRQGVKKFTLNERPLASNRLWYASTLDRSIKNMPIEIKTGGIYEADHRRQTANHCVLLQENYGYDLPEKRLLVYLNDNSFTVKEHKNTKDDVMVWEACVTFYHYRRATNGTG